MKHIKLFEDFNQDSNMGPEYFDLTDGRKVFFWEEPFEDMGGETNYMVKYKIGKSLEDCEDSNYEEVSKLLKPLDKGNLDDFIKSVNDENESRSRNHVK